MKKATNITGIILTIILATSLAIFFFVCMSRYAPNYYNNQPVLSILDLAVKVFSNLTIKDIIGLILIIPTINMLAFGIKYMLVTSSRPFYLS